MSNNLKQIRGQIRQIVQEILPELVKQELYNALSVQINNRVDAIVKEIRGRLDAVDDRAKTLQNYALRQSTSVQVKPGVQKNE